MAHEIDFTTGKPAIAYRGDKPWHGYGQEITEDLPLEVWRTLAGLDWSVKRRPMFYHPLFDQEDDGRVILGCARGTNGLNYKRVPNRTALTRSDSGALLSVVSDRFKVVQPKQVIEFFRSLIEHNGFKMVTAGALRDGKRIWALAETGKDFTINGDRVACYLLLATAYDGTFSTTVQFTSIRVVCNNTLQGSLNRGGEGGVIRIPHNVKFNEFDVKADLGLDSGWTDFRNNVVQLTEHRVTKRDAIEYFLDVCGVTEEEAADGKQLSNVKKLLSLYETGPGADMSTAKDTLWGCVNAVSCFTDHVRRGKDNGTRFDSASFGSGAKMKRVAWDRAIDIMEAA